MIAQSHSPSDLLKPLDKPLENDEEMKGFGKGRPVQGGVVVCQKITATKPLSGAAL